ncbi:MAG: NAD(P)/FAD-dependent oxidoreductase [Rhodospirillum sp.]|nr:NAD(P)/FAD-dependent oxidoreductase [Rhodospirillum sp.]MCF8490939.1 NAD(P)/FAD-dependent oxidoreductase [Rhodospirillum sp.]MCF8502637.1 NAD(P)/FAD-dependent oxidoreductase [Rhodospirillum sp.]
MDAIVDDAKVKAQTWLDALAGALAKEDIEAAIGLFAEECYWRDLVAFSWNIATFEGKAAIADMLKATLTGAKPTGWEVDEASVTADGVVEAWFHFETAVARGTGHLRLHDGAAWTLLTSMDELKGHEEKRRFTRDKGVAHGVDTGRETWGDRRARDARELGYSRQPYVVILGGGQGGIALGARLKQLGVPTLIIEKNERAGDSWRKRYKSLCLHDPVWYDHLPYIPFPDNWPIFTPKDKVGDWLEMYTKVMELDYWTSSVAERATWDDDTKEWTVVVKREGETVTLTPKQLVLATGMSGMANIPEIPGAAGFKGVHCHSSQHPGGEGWRGKRAVVIGSNNSAHDICADLWENGADVTMLQRSSTHVVRSDSLMEVSMGPLYSEEARAKGITTEKADLTFASIPYAVLPQVHKPVYDEIRRRDADFYKRLEKVGFMLDYGDDESGLFLKYLRRASGYYIDVGASELVAEGKIKLKTGNIREITESGVVMDSDEEIPADLIVYATGYGSMNGWAAQLISQEVADKVGKCWGLGSDTTKDPGPWEGELRNMWKPTQQEGLWFHGGNLHQSRFYSAHLALQLKARQAGIPTPVTGLAKSYHRA